MSMRFWLGRQPRERSSRRIRRQRSVKHWNQLMKRATQCRPSHWVRGGWEAITLDSLGVIREGDLEGVRLASTHGDNSIALLVSLKTGRLCESPVNESMVPGSSDGDQALAGSPRSLMAQQASLMMFWTEFRYLRLSSAPDNRQDDRGHEE